MQPFCKTKRTFFTHDVRLLLQMCVYYFKSPTFFSTDRTDRTDRTDLGEAIPPEKKIGKKSCKIWLVNYCMINKVHNKSAFVHNVEFGANFHGDKSFTEGVQG